MPVVHKPPMPTIIPVTDSMKSKLNTMSSNVNMKIDAKYGSNTSAKLTHYQTLISALQGIKNKLPTLADLIDYLISNFEEQLALLQLQDVLNVN
ncbi:MAG: hypothetical protein GXP45_04490 [bacterium]|nr:hypothetical protein [bacterium]